MPYVIALVVSYVIAILIKGKVNIYTIILGAMFFSIYILYRLFVTHMLTIDSKDTDDSDDDIYG